MIAYAADFMLWVAVLLCLVQMLGFRGERRFARAAASTLFIVVSFSFLALIYSFVISDFSLKVVFENSHTAKPLLYKISGTWGNHEGSLLMLTWVLALYGFLYSRSHFNARALAMQGMICLLFLLFMKLTSDPFTTMKYIMPNGRGLNPLLQDIGLAFHPPILYTGYVGFSLVFSIAVGALLDGELDKNFARSARLWCMVSWSFLTLGIGLGSWWAYRELGWGGFWFWDPVENASLMPWLAGTALLHSLIVTGKRKTLKAWTMLLAIVTFGLSLSGFFLVRSGVLTSVHSFASDPERGIAMLIVLSIILGFAFITYAFRAHKLKSHGEFVLLSRETGILVNNLLLVVLCATVFTGTVYPLILSALGGDSISVGPPFYAVTFVPGAIIILYLCAASTLAKWRENKIKQLAIRMAAPFTIPLAISVCAYFLLDFSLGQAVTLLAGLYLLCAVIWEFRHHRHMDNLPMLVAHGGVALLALGVLLSTAFPGEVRANMKEGDKTSVSGFDIILNKVEESRHENYAYRRGLFDIRRKDKFVAHMEPEMRVYPIEHGTTTEADIYRHAALSDLYLIIGEKNNEGLYAVRAYYKPFINLIWLGCLIMFCGGMMRVLLQIGHAHRLVSAHDADHGGADHDDKQSR